MNRLPKIYFYSVDLAYLKIKYSNRMFVCINEILLEEITNLNIKFEVVQPKKII